MKKFSNYIYLFFAQYKIFWLIQGKKEKLIFSIKKFLFYFKKSLIKKMQTRIFYIFSIIFATYILQIINPSLDYWIKAFLHGYLKPDNVVFKLNLVTNSEYITFLTAIAAIGGVFIGLYFSSLSGINATLYSTFSKDLRDLLYRDKISSRYIRNLSFTTFFAFTLIVFFLLGFEKIYIVIPILLFLIGFTIFSYFKMGNRMHELLNVDTLSIPIFDNIFKYIKNATKKDIYNRDKNFQNHYFSLATQELKILTSLLETSLHHYKIHNSSLQNIHLNILNLLAFYQAKKRYIPFESMWYKQKYEYKDLYKMGNLSSMNIYLQSGSMPHGENKSDLFWIEDKTISYVIRILINKIENNEIEDYQNILTNILQYLKILVRFGNIEYAIKVAKQLKEAIYSSDKIESSKQILLTDYIYSLPVEIILEFFRNLNMYSYSEVSKIVNSNDLSKDFAQKEFTESLSETLNWLQKKLDLEIKAEGREISHKWYQIEIIMLTLSKQFIEKIESINNLFDEYFDNNLENKDIQLYSIALNRKWECINKYIVNFHLIENILTEYKKERRIDDLNWKKFSIEDYKNNNKSLRNKYIVEIGTVLDKVENRQNTDIPDIKGFFLQVTSENLLDLAIEKNFDNLIKIYPNFLVSSMFKYYELKPDFNATIEEFDFRKENELVNSFLPILNLIEITGLIKIILEFNNKEETWKLIESYWLNILNNDDKFISIDFLKIVISSSDFKKGAPPGFEQRFNWNLKIRDYLKSKVKRDFYTKNYGGITSFIHQEEIVLHNNVLVRKYIGEERPSRDIDGITLFIYAILTKNFKDIDFEFEWPRKQQDFVDSLKRNEEIYKEYKNARKIT